MVARYIRWTYEGYDSISRSLSSFFRRKPDALRKIVEVGVSFEEKLQIRERVILIDGVWELRPVPTTSS